MGRLAKLLLYLAAIAYPGYEFGVERIQVLSYEGIGSIAFPAVVFLFQLPGLRKGGAKPSLKRVFSEFLSAAVLATLAQFVYLGIEGYLSQPEEMRQMIRFDWIALPFVLIILRLLSRKSRRG